MTQALRDRYEDLDLTPGKGRGSAALSIALGLLAFLGALCFLFPYLFTTPEFRGLYNIPLLKGILYVSIAISFAFGCYSLFVHFDKRFGLTGMALATGAALLSSSAFEPQTVQIRGLYTGLDYFILTLLILAAIFIPLERAFPKNPEKRILRDGWIADIKYFLFSHVGVQLISFFTVIPIQIFLANHVNGDFQKLVASQPVTLQFFEILAVVDFGTYWIHRAMHEIPALWKIHAVHHSSQYMDWLASSRLHLFEILMNRFAGYLPIFLLGFSPAAVYAYLVFVSFHAIFIHANVRFRFPYTRWLIATPEFHHWHHSSEAAAIDKNYAAFLPIYDVIFKTAYLPDTLAQKFG
ncbi:MAG TPA: sterol desaturase family protein, partial [Candidatus Obscuribacterales bacterium]